LPQLFNGMQVERWREHIHSSVRGRVLHREGNSAVGEV
jgi:hypothetical protein